MLGRLLSIACAAAVLAGPAHGADFYQGKTLTVIVGYAPGGGVDATARAITRHLARFIPGNPNIVVQNMEGAAGLVSVHHLDRRVAPDGLTLAVPGRSWYLEAIVKRKGASFDPTKLTYVGSPGPVSAALYIRKSTGIKTYDELKRSKKTLTVGALGPTTPTAMGPKLLAVNGAPLKVVLGYVSTARILYALEQGELDGSFSVGNALESRPDLYAQVTAVVETGDRRGSVPNMRDVIGKEHWPVLDLVTASDSIGVPLVGPANMAAEPTAILRKAFLAMAKDKAYRADAVKVGLPVGQALDGAKIGGMITALAKATTPPVIAEFNRLAGRK
jgi:hypothetical protein